MSFKCSCTSTSGSSVSNPVNAWCFKTCQYREIEFNIHLNVTSPPTPPHPHPAYHMEPFLAPYFFLVCINNVVENLLSTCIVRLFADDNSLAYSSADKCDIEDILNHDLLVLSTWRKQWLVNFNPSKTEAIVFSCYDISFSESFVRRCFG